MVLNKKIVSLTTLLYCSASPALGCEPAPDSNYSIRDAFRKQSIELTPERERSIEASVRVAALDSCRDRGNSRIKFASVEIATNLGLNPTTDSSVADRVRRAIETLPCGQPVRCEEPGCLPDLSWDTYFNKTLSLNSNAQFLTLVNQKGFSPVKISWEDIGRYQNSAWGDRISDVGIWVRKDEHDPSSSQLALSVRRDNNFRDKVLVVPADKIKVHSKQNGRTIEHTLPQRLAELGLTSKSRDQNVIVSNQFAIVPVPKRGMEIGGSRYQAPRAAFNFSIYPYGSTNFVITDVIEGSSEAVVGPGNHQLLFADVGGQKAPFTASRASERPDLLQLEADLKSQGMDVDVQRYYLIQVPLRAGSSGIELANMGTPPRGYNSGYPGQFAALGSSFGADLDKFEKKAPALPQAAGAVPLRERSGMRYDSKEEGLTKVAIGTGDTEGEYRVGSGYRGMRADEPVRVTVVYFVTPLGEVIQRDMEKFSAAFAAWDSQAIWGGSFVTKDS